MSSKINVIEIIRGHFKTLCDAGQTKLSAADIITFLVVPFFFAALGAILSFDLDNNIAPLLVNFGAIFTALLLSVLVLVYDQETKLESNGTRTKLADIRARLLDQLYYNICYAIICSMLLVLACFAFYAVNKITFQIPMPNRLESFKFNLGIHVVTPVAVFLTLNLSLTIIMVVKRMHILLTTK